jgi:hypothetical protein
MLEGLCQFCKQLVTESPELTSWTGEWATRSYDNDPDLLALRPYAQRPAPVDKVIK